MAESEVWHEYRGVGLAPPDWGAFLREYDRIRIPLALAAAKRTEADGELEKEKLRAVVRLAQIEGDLAKQETYQAAILGQAERRSASDELKARTERYKARAVLQGIDLTGKYAIKQQNTETANKATVSSFLTPTDLASIDETKTRAAAAFDGVQGTFEEKVAAAARVFSQEFAAKSGNDTNVLHGSAYADAMAKSLATVTKAKTAEELGFVNQYAEQYLYGPASIPARLDKNGMLSANEAIQQDPDLRAIYDAANAEIGPNTPGLEKPAQATAVGTQPAQAPAAPATKAAPASPAPPNLPTSAETPAVYRSNPNAPATTGTAETPVPAATVTGQPTPTSVSEMPLSTTAYLTSEGVPVMNSAALTQGHTGVVSNVLSGQRPMRDEVYQSYKDDEARRLAAAKDQGTIALKMRDVRPHPRQAEVDAREAMFQKLRETDPRKYHEMQLVLQQFRMAKIPGAEVKRDQRVNEVDKARDAVVGSPGIRTTGPTVEDAAKAMAASYADMKAEIANKKLTGDAATQVRDKWMHEHAVVMADLPPDDRAELWTAVAMDPADMQSLVDRTAARIRMAEAAKAREVADFEADHNLNITAGAAEAQKNTISDSLVQARAIGREHSAEYGRLTPEQRAQVQAAFSKPGHPMSAEGAAYLEGLREGTPDDESLTPAATQEDAAKALGVTAVPNLPVPEKAAQDAAVGRSRIGVVPDMAPSGPGSSVMHPAAPPMRAPGVEMQGAPDMEGGGGLSYSPSRFTSQEEIAQAALIAKNYKKKQPKATAAETQAFVDVNLADWRKWRAAKAMDPNQPLPDVPMMEPR